MNEKKSLKDPPKNLREAINWLALVGGGFGGSAFGGLGKYNDLAAALKELPEFDEAKKQAFDKIEPSSVINKLADKLGRGFLGHMSQGGTEFSGDGIIKNNGGYKSTYENAQWPSNGDRQTCALIFLGSAYVTYYFVTYTYWRCKQGINGAWQGFTLDGTGTWLKDYMEGMGFNINSLVKDKWGYELAQLLEKEPNGFTELNVSGPSFYNSYTYSQYLEKLNEKDKNVDWNYPLIGCYRLANCYFSLHSDKKEVAEAMKNIRSEFESVSTKRNSESNIYEVLKQNIHTFLSKVTTFTPTPAPNPPGSPSPSGSNTSSSQSSPAGSIAGTLTTLGMGGGAAAAYLLNVGGAKTLVNGLLRIG